jgi:hypothetical protein
MQKVYNYLEPRQIVVAETLKDDVAFRLSSRPQAEVLSAVLSGQLHANGREIAVDHVLRPETGLDVSRLSTDGELLRQAANEAHRAVIDRLRL